MPDISKAYELVILDDVFPQSISSFRYAEFIYYFEKIPNVLVVSSGWLLMPEYKDFNSVLEEFKKNAPEIGEKVEIYSDSLMPVRTKLFYSIFLNNIFNFLPYIEKCAAPFIFTLYPGGGFWINNEESDKKLRSVFASPYFQKVIVTQMATLNYLVENNFCLEDRIVFIYGGVAPKQKKTSMSKKIFFDKKKKQVLDICFVAAKYSERGVDKGYDVFIEFAKQIAKKYFNINFHVVGGFNENDINVDELTGRITFYGYRLTDWFRDFYHDKEIIISPNIPNMLAFGAFDGFPLGVCVEASLNHLAMFCTDEMNLNISYKDRKDIVIIPHDPKKIEEIIAWYYHNPKAIKKLARHGYKKTLKLFSVGKQLKPRIKVLKWGMKK